MSSGAEGGKPPCGALPKGGGACPALICSTRSMRRSRNRETIKGIRTPSSAAAPPRAVPRPLRSTPSPAAQRSKPAVMATPRRTNSHVMATTSSITASRVSGRAMASRIWITLAERAFFWRAVHDRQSASSFRFARVYRWRIKKWRGRSLLGSPGRKAGVFVCVDHGQPCDGSNEATASRSADRIKSWRSSRYISMRRMRAVTVSSSMKRSNSLGLPPT